MRPLYGYAAVQLWAEAVNRAGTAEVQAVALALRAHRFDIILRTVGFDAKGEGTGYEPFTWYIRWRVSVAPGGTREHLNRQALDRRIR